MKTKSSRGRPERGGLFRTVAGLCLSGMFCALSFVLAYLAKLIFSTNPLRLTFENLPIILAGFLFGPLAGGAVGVGADLLSCVSAGQGVNPLITVGSASIGLLAGGSDRLLSWLGHRKNREDLPRPPRSFGRILLCEALAHTVGSMVIKSVALHAYGYEWAYLALRVPIYICVIFAESYALYRLLKNPAVRKVLPN